ncbi:hypothetical protein GGR53DRAFT_514031 [Hypoxylon sp. FL1150]|nr:hypothetical protein GGR53DRAFT_514031 [Hypoxylon sp. FL1150]
MTFEVAMLELLAFNKMPPRQNPTIRDVLREALPEIDIRVRPGGNSQILEPIRLEVVEDWPEFDHETLYAIFGKDIEKEYKLQKYCMVTPIRQDRIVVDELSLEDYLRAFVSRPVNYALQTLQSQPYFGRGTRAGIDYGEPDWSLISEDRRDQEGYLLNLLPGETKLGTKFWYKMPDEGEHAKVLEQATTYMALAHGRYGFLITDQYLHPLRLSLVPTGRGLAKGRLPRSISNPTIVVADTSGVSEGSVFVDDNPRDWQYKVEVGTVRLFEPRKGKLCGREGLWYLAQLATFGASTILSRYAALNSWSTNPSGGFIHNVTGAWKAKLSKYDELDDTELGDSRGSSESLISTTLQVETDMPVFSQPGSTSGDLFAGGLQYAHPQGSNVEIIGEGLVEAQAESSSAAAARTPVRSSRRLEGGTAYYHSRIQKDKQGFFYMENGNKHRTTKDK